MISALDHIHLYAADPEAERFAEDELTCKCAHGWGDVAAALLELRADVRPVNSGDGTNALYHACKNNLGGVGSMLIECGADVKAPRLERQRQREDGTNTLYWACAHGLDDVALMLLERGADPNAVNRTTGSSTLHGACERGLGDVAMRLIERGAVAEVASKNGTNALYWACN